MSYIPQRGDIVHLTFDPASGTEMNGKHYGLVLSGKLFNAIGLAMICPISQGRSQFSRNQGLIVTLMGTGTDTQGNIHCHQLKSLDWKIRKAVFKERVDDYIVNDVLARIDTVLND